jgi:hypothetical protein
MLIGRQAIIDQMVEQETFGELIGIFIQVPGTCAFADGISGPDSFGVHAVHDAHADFDFAFAAGEINPVFVFYLMALGKAGVRD